jgi:hypothetical protein
MGYLDRPVPENRFEGDSDVGESVPYHARR